MVYIGKRNQNQCNSTCFIQHFSIDKNNLFTLMSVISGGGVAPLHNPLPDLVLLRVEVEVDLPLGLEHHLTGTDGTRLFVGETLRTPQA